MRLFLENEYDLDEDEEEEELDLNDFGGFRLMIFVSLMRDD